MNSESIDFKFFIESDNNPFILFGVNGKILFLNDAAEIMLGYTTTQNLYNTALIYAPKNFGYKTTHVEIQYDMLLFYALTVAYQNEEQIGLKLYLKPRMDTAQTINTDKLQVTNINALLEANIALFKIHNNGNLTLLTDHDLPSCRIDQNNFSKLMRKIFDLFTLASSVHITLKLIVGEYIIIQNRREQILQLSIQADIRNSSDDQMIQKMAQEIHTLCICKADSITLHIPFIQK